jgi:hypothetical protein
MGTRSAPLVFLLLAACMATDGTESAVRDGSRAAPGATAATQSPSSTGLPAIPRMRPEPPRKTRSAGTAVAQSGGAAKDADGQPGGGAKGAKPSTGGSGVTQAGAQAPEQTNATTQTDTKTAIGTISSADSADAPGADPSRPPDPQAEGGQPPEADPTAGGTGIALLPGVDASSTSSGTMSEPGSPPVDPADGSLSGMDAGAGNAGPAADREPELAVLMPPEIDPGIDVESLFDGDVVRYCAAMWRMGEYIGAARRRGEPLQQSIGDAVRRIAAEKQLPLDNRLAFSGQVYGRLVYRLEDSHAALTLGAYVHFACLTVRGDKRIVPADPNAERLLNSGLARCENTAFTRDALNDCIFRELTPIVDRRNG